MRAPSLPPSPCSHYPVLQIAELPRYCADDAELSADDAEHAKERLVARDMQSWQTSTEMNYDPPIPTELKVDVGGSAGVDTVAFTSTTRGTGNDNAADPANLTLQQKARAVTLNYQDKSCINITFSVPAKKDNPQYKVTSDDTKFTYGRNFLFSGGGGVNFECTRTSPPPSASPSPPPMPPPTSPPPLTQVAVANNELSSAPTGPADATFELIGGGIAAVALLALLFFASRCVPSPLLTPRSNATPWLPFAV